MGKCMCICAIVNEPQQRLIEVHAAREPPFGHLWDIRCNTYYTLYISPTYQDISLYIYAINNDLVYPAAFYLLWYRKLWLMTSRQVFTMRDNLCNIRWKPNWQQVPWRQFMLMTPVGNFRVLLTSPKRNTQSLKLNYGCSRLTNSVALSLSDLAALSQTEK